ncbi:MAG: 23S rRNA (pseudouridine(1915)-N(3))-methyltransferase RlmH [Bacteroidales bacterium]|nr:23S rRNA (pseudouridine(1915)-N(3))-methyltransferase RlmH [Bacteroidales bacterium]
MNIELLCIGKENADHFEDAISQYVKKIKLYNNFGITVIPYLKNTKSLSFEEQKKKEGELLLKKIDNTDFVVLLDERGKEIRSTEFANFLQQKMNSGIKKLVFIIGGAYGFSEEVYRRQNAQISLSKLTFPHLMTRLIFVEQLYRAFTILHNEPYHHD